MCPFNELHKMTQLQTFIWSMSLNTHLHTLPLAGLTRENIKKSAEPEAMRWQWPGKAQGGNLIGHVKGPLLMAYSSQGMPLLRMALAMWGICWREHFPPVSRSTGEERTDAARARQSDAVAALHADRTCRERCPALSWGIICMMHTCDSHWHWLIWTADPQQSEMSHYEFCWFGSGVHYKGKDTR